MMRLKPASLAAAVVDLLLAVYAYVFLEWLFFITKPSFLSVLAPTQKLSVALLVALPLIALVLALLLLCAALAGVLPARILRERAKPLFLERLPEGAIYTVLVLLLVDNFTYTMFGVGVISTGGIAVYAYAVVFLALLVWFWRRGSQRSLGDTDSYPVWKLPLAVGLLAASTALLLVALLQVPALGVDSPKKSDLPTIVFFAADGVDADLLSAYGARYETSPALNALLPESRVFNAAMSNAARTTGSTTSMLNGKYPTTTKVMFPPHALTGADSFQHLPGILRRAGYTLFQESIRYYADAPDLNMQESFHVANRREVKSSLPTWLPADLALAVPDALLFFERLRQRAVNRLLHISGVRSMEDVFAQVGGGTAKVYGFRDRGRIDEAVRFLNEEQGPVFLHLHLMDTHCCRFRPTTRRFSKNHETQSEENFYAFLIDAVLSSDERFEELITALEDTGRIDNTLIVYSSDHGVRWRANRRMPLVIRFPGGAHAREVNETVQLLDVAPTILDYLSIPIPRWMEGSSLLGTSVPPTRPVFSVAGVERKVMKTDKDTVSRLVGSGPPRYGMKTMQLTVCDRWYALTLETGQLETGRVPGHPEPCEESQLPTSSEAREAIVQHLQTRRFVLPVASYPAISD